MSESPSADSHPAQDSERSLLLDYVMAQRKDFIQDLLDELGMPKSGIKTDLRSRIEDALDADRSGLDSLINFLNKHEPWGKQQVTLLRAPSALAKQWREEPEKIRAQIEATDAADALGDGRSLVLPENLTLSSIGLDDAHVTIQAVERRTYLEREPALDQAESGKGERIEYRAYVRRVARGLVTLRWDLNTRAATLHISQGHRSYEYSTARDAFASMLAPWLSLDLFDALDLRPAVAALHKLEKDTRGRKGATAATRAHRLAIKLLDGSTVGVTSPDAATPMVGNKIIDQTVGTAKAAGTGQTGNVYFLSGPKSPIKGQDIHVIVAAEEGRIYIRHPSEEQSVTYILETIRGLC